MKGIITVKLEYDFPNATTKAEVVEELENVELPENYVEDSFEIASINGESYEGD